jgi:hypothetical protein
MEFAHVLIIAGAVLVVLGIIALHLATTPRDAEDTFRIRLVNRISYHSSQWLGL